MKFFQPLLVLSVIMLGGGGLVTPVWAREFPSEIERLVEEFPALDDLESSLGFPSRARTTSNSLPSQPARGWIGVRTGGRGDYQGMKATFASSSLATSPAASDDNPFATLLANWEASQREATDLAGSISRKNNRRINKYFMDRILSTARTDYGTAITGVFAQGVGFGTFEQALRQNYTTTYSLPLLTRYAGSTKWTRIWAGWTISSSVGVEPKLSELLQMQNLLRGLRLSWSVALSYNLPWTNIRKIADGQLAQEAALVRAADRALATRDELVKKIASRMGELAANQPVRDTRLESLRELYPQFELYRARFRQARTCDERLEHFFTLKGLALSLLTLAEYEHPGNGSTNLMASWKKARNLGCPTYSASAEQFGSAF